MTDTQKIQVGDLIDNSRWSGYQKWLLALTAVAFAVDGMANQVLAVAIPSLMEVWQIGRDSFSPVLFWGLFGVTAGSLVGGLLGDKIGRRWALIASMLIFGAATVATGFAANIDMLKWLRLLDGFGIGAAIPNGAALISEYTPERRRSRGIAWGMVFIPVGSSLVALLGSLLLKEGGHGWDIYFMVAGAVPLLAALSFVFVLPESPRYLQSQPQRRQELLHLLRRFGHALPDGTRFVEQPIGRLHLQLTALFAKAVRRDTLAIWGAFFFALIAGYSLFSWIPTMLRGAGFSFAQAGSGISSLHFGGIAGGVAVGWIIEQLGSRRSLLGLALGSIAMALALSAVLAATDTSFGTVAVLLAFEGFFIAGINTVVYTLAAHAYSPVVKATGVGAAATVGRLGAMASSYSGEWTLSWGGAPLYFIGVAVLVGLCLVFGLLVSRHIGRYNSQQQVTAANPRETTQAQQAALEHS